MVGVLVHVGCYHKMPVWVADKQWKFITILEPERPRSESQCGWVRVLFWLQVSGVLHTVEGMRDLLEPLL